MVGLRKLPPIPNTPTWFCRLLEVSTQFFCQPCRHQNPSIFAIFTTIRQSLSNMSLHNRSLCHSFDIFNFFSHRQDIDCVEVDTWGDTIRCTSEALVRPFPFYLWRRSLQRRQLRVVWLMGQDSALVGLGCWKNNSSVRGPHQGLIKIYSQLDHN